MVTFGDIFILGGVIAVTLLITELLSLVLGMTSMIVTGKTEVPLWKLLLLGNIEVIILAICRYIILLMWNVEVL